ncbi:MAG: hypothetical protein AB7J28_17135 [Hyphomonadaceae bacterium]
MASAEASRTGIDSARYFYVGVAAFVVIFTFGAFTRSYWAPLSGGSLDMHAAIHAHAALFFLWTLFFLTQTLLAAQGRTLAHRELGMFGVALAGAMVFSGVVASVVTLAQLMDSPRERVVIGTSILGLSSMIVFTTFMTAAVANIRRPEWHKRLMVLATFALMQAVVTRYILLIPDIIQPHRALIGATITDLMLLAVILADARIKGRVHPVYLAGGAFLLFVQIARSPLTHTPFWRDACHWLASLTG